MNEKNSTKLCYVKKIVSQKLFFSIQKVHKKNEMLSAKKTSYRK